MVLNRYRNPIAGWVLSRMAPKKGHQEESRVIVGAHGCYEMGHDYDAPDNHCGYTGNTSRWRQLRNRKRFTSSSR